MPYCNHSAGDKRPLRIRGFDTPQMVCAKCWNKAIRMGEVERDPYADTVKG